jgi:thiamine biosynthesis lipoprotein
MGDADAVTAAPASPATPGSDLTVTFRSMASDVRLWVVGARPGAQEALDAARAVVERVAASCTRFDPDSALMQANARGRAWTEVPRETFDAIAAAHDAYVTTGGLFDPRVLRVLTAYGYDTTLPFEGPPVNLPGATAAPRTPVRGMRTWKPKFDEERLAVKVGPEPIDLGGIGKGLAMTWAARQLAGAGEAALVEAGGDLMALGGGTDGEGWMVGVENPFADGDSGADPAAVLRLTDRGCATSSIRIRSWKAGGEDVHHLVDPRTGRSAQAALRSVTVVGKDPAVAEVWSKSLFVVGKRDIRSAADEHGLAAVWVDSDGYVGVSRAMRPYVAWQVSRVA